MPPGDQSSMGGNAARANLQDLPAFKPQLADPSSALSFCVDVHTEMMGRVMEERPELARVATVVSDEAGVLRLHNAEQASAMVTQVGRPCMALPRSGSTNVWALSGANPLAH